MIELRRGFDLPSSDRVPGIFPIVSAGKLNGTHHEARVDGPGFAVGRATNLGKPQWSDTDFWPLNTTLYAADFKGNNPKWLYHLFETLDLAGYDSGSVQPMLNRNYIKHVPVMVPPRVAQDAIAEVLGALDDKIAANRRVQRSIDDLLDASFRKASRSTAERVELGSLIALNYGKSLPSSKRVEGPFPVVGSGGVVGYHDESLVDGPAVIVGRKGSVGSTYWISEGCFPIDTTYWVAPNGVSLGYAYRLLQDIDFVAMNTDSAVPGLNRERAYALQVPLPDGAHLEEFDRLSGALTSKHSALQVETSALARTRDELLPLLMNGRIAVKEAEQAAEAVL
ncbi:restriction endonuclease subunit S [Dietzia cinnamea]|uniref:restriction endonuclease subunit S n=1 Tax=Dietzia cinnamea TaxID=321318 RepID=UPI0021AE41C2|nr:restriction endonuclease subunit S [Dietzia cinnamea]MCT2062989.1 restriction endonuclease subunit S [Dietzia cinnamea]MCT2172931.1 restriction endonuclease subunit S [Dietzia cinnamea]MCT2235306.1 restriction endonuclease subunit S [Dietzia cinnamea]MCT2302548.1 restriction endonuclease subunit S [Dietzia cinnamea]